MKQKSDYPSFSKTLLLVLIVFAISCAMKYFGGGRIRNSAERTINEYARTHGYSMSDYPEALVNALNKNEEIEDYVLQYPRLSRQTVMNNNITLTEYEDTDELPMLMQWDERWGYRTYNGEPFGLSGSAPTCLSMAAVYLLRDAALSPVETAGIASDNQWEAKPDLLLSEGARSLGITVSMLKHGEASIKEILDYGEIVVALTDGKLLSKAIIIYSYDKKEGFSVRDPASQKLSQRKYKYSELGKHIEKMWSYSLVQQD